MGSTTVGARRICRVSGPRARTQTALGLPGSRHNGGGVDADGGLVQRPSGRFTNYIGVVCPVGRMRILLARVGRRGHRRNRIATAVLQIERN
jgi:hypothetical protein